MKIFVRILSCVLLFLSCPVIACVQAQEGVVQEVGDVEKRVRFLERNQEVFFVEWQKQRTERKRIHAEIEKARSEALEAQAAAEEAAADARKASAENRKWRFWSILTIAGTALVFYLIPPFFLRRF